MTYYLTIYSDAYCVIRRYRGYTGGQIFIGEKITPAQYKKLFYSTENRQIVKPPLTNQFDEVRLQVNAKQVLEIKG